jgi:threonine dehydrogenase-like Zn-dependent dehydrogenase
MQGAVLYGPRDVRFEERAAPRIVEPTDAIITLSSTCICGSDLWPYRGINPVSEPTPMGHEYCGIVEEVGRAVASVDTPQDGTDNAVHDGSNSTIPQARVDDERRRVDRGLAPRRASCRPVAQPADR